MREKSTPPASVESNTLSTITSTTAGTCWVRQGVVTGAAALGMWVGRAKATWGVSLCQVDLLLVDGGVNVDGTNAGRQAQGALVHAQDGDLQHGVQEGHPVILPQ